MLVDGITDTHVQGKLWHQNEHRYAGAIRLKMPYAAKLRPKIVHYLGPQEIKYASAYRFWLGETTRVPHLFLDLRGRWAHLSRTVFHQRSQLEVDRDKLLEYVVDEYAVSETGFDAGSVLNSMYNDRWYLHPGRYSAKKRTEYLLDSLVVTGDLKKTTSSEYKVQPGAFKSLNEIQVARQRHRQLLYIQGVVLFLTFGSLITALIQAGIIKSPPVLKVDCRLESAAARDCTIRYSLFPDKMLESVK